MNQKSRNIVLEDGLNLILSTIKKSMDNSAISSLRDVAEEIRAESWKLMILILFQNMALVVSQRVIFSSKRYEDYGKKMAKLFLTLGINEWINGRRMIEI